MDDDSHRNPERKAGITSGVSDAEAGGPGGDQRRELAQEVFGLDVMYERGLIGEDDYRQRRAELEKQRDQS